MATHALRRDKAPRKYYPHPRFPNEIDALDSPEIYSSQAHGNCLASVFAKGSRLIMSKREKPRAGDLVALWFDPERLRDDARPRSFVRLACDLPAGLRFPYHPKSSREITPLVRVEKFNPAQEIAIPATRIVAMHRVIGAGLPSRPGKARLVVEFGKGEAWA